ncbi:uncharacterized protein [Rutidosis leptorrhynchoides]|uniref:uncharacterized protein n=1 Tax=Rutidosis leptorrhynchoides TaxID=125765 RepID=UPI003A99555B
MDPFTDSGLDKGGGSGGKFSFFEEAVKDLEGLVRVEGKLIGSKTLPKVNEKTKARSRKVWLASMPLFVILFRGFIFLMKLRGYIKVTVLPNQTQLLQIRISIVPALRCGSLMVDKRKWVKDLCISLNVQFLAIQESKMSRLHMSRLRTFWGNHNFDFALSLARGYSGGIISLWDPNVFIRSDIWCDDNFVIVKGTWLQVNLDVFMVNVYAPQALADKVLLWAKISNFIDAHPGEYILMGDWNSVRSIDESCGSIFCTHDARAFKDFIDHNAFYDMPLGGLQFTWCNKPGNKFSKIDRFFVTNNVFNVVDDLKGLVLPRGYSDHSPILLFQDKVDFGPTYFKIFDSWFSRPDFELTVRKAWDIISIEANMDIVAKFRLLKGHLKSWIHSSRSTEAKRLKELKDNIIELDAIIDSGNASSNEVNLRNSLAFEKDDISKMFDLDMLQKASGVLVDGVWFNDPNVIKSKFFDHFEAKFIDHGSDVSSGHVTPHAQISVADVNEIDKDVDDEEIKNAVWNCGSSKAPGPDVGCFYKVVTKILTNRLQRVIDKIISPVQSAFIAGRQILDGPLMLSEILSWYKYKNKKMLLFKVDFEKAYDSVNWEYLLFMLSSLGFSEKWCSWIKGCLFSARTSVLINGSPTREFMLKKGFETGGST